MTESAFGKPANQQDDEMNEEDIKELMARMTTDELEIWKNFDDQKKEDFREIFDIFDADHGGAISNSEIKQCMQTLGQNPTDDDIKEIITEVDYNGDGEVNFAEFLVMMAKQQRIKNEEEEEMVTVFNKFDIGKDGQISAEDLMLRFRELGDDIDETTAHEMIAIMDKDGDGHFNFTEFIQLMMFDTQDVDLYRKKVF